MSSREKPTPPSNPGHLTDFDQSWARKAPFHPTAQLGYGKRPELNQVYTAQTHSLDDAQCVDALPSNYDYPEGSHLVNPDTIEEHRRNIRTMQISSALASRQVDQGRMYENCQPESVRAGSGIHAVDCERFEMENQEFLAATTCRFSTETTVPMIAVGLSSPNFATSSLRIKTTLIYNLPCGKHVGHAHQQEVLPPHAKEMSGRKVRYCEAPQTQFAKRDDERKVGQPMPQSLDGPSDQETRQGLTVQTTNPFLTKKNQLFPEATPNWMPKTKVQTVVEMINHRNEPLPQSHFKEAAVTILTPMGEKEYCLDSTLDRKRTDCQGRYRRDCEETCDEEIRKNEARPSDQHQPNRANVAVQVKTNVLPAPPLPEGILKRPQKETPPTALDKKALKTKNDLSEYSNSSTVSANSSLSSDDSTTTPTGVEVTPRDLGTEADLLLFYFKQHATVLNFIGIQLPKELVAHIVQLPESPRVELELRKATPQHGQTRGTTTKQRPTGKEKVMRRASSKNERKTKRQLSTRTTLKKVPESEDSPAATEELFDPEKGAVAVGKTIISISRGAYSGYPEEQTQQKEAELRQHQLLEMKKKEIIDDFHDVSRQMVSREASLSISGSEERRSSRKVDQSTLRRSSATTYTSDDFSDTGHQRRSEHSPLSETQTAESRSGRFMKKSAAALIAKKQTSRNNSPSPGNNFKEKAQGTNKKQIDCKPTQHRIAAEIANLREREDELRRNRHQLGLPSLEDIVDIWRQGHGGYGRPPTGGLNAHHDQIAADSVGIGAPLRSARSFDHLHFEANEGNKPEAGCRVAKSESFHQLQLEAGRGMMQGNVHDDYGSKGIHNPDMKSCLTQPGQEYMGRARGHPGNHDKFNSSGPHNQFEYRNVQIKIRAGNDYSDGSGTLDSRASEARGNARLRRHYHHEYPAVRL
ncbi:hypothetical protein L596_003125 [Steinernema carpocapsae]|uniref:Uncharacterized protein n=1 Tax=Steinernema carpocapsae TaxID=34508 RepID=A0A4U8UT61_STECR|nr:hypothetical protein L596_003125 [Steinernema carpocapsae]